MPIGCLRGIAPAFLCIAQISIYFGFHRLSRGKPYEPLAFLGRMAADRGSTKDAHSIFGSHAIPAADKRTGLKKRRRPARSSDTHARGAQSGLHSDWVTSQACTTLEPAVAIGVGYNDFSRREFQEAEPNGAARIVSPSGMSTPLSFPLALAPPRRRGFFLRGGPKAAKREGCLDRLALRLETARPEASHGSPLDPRACPGPSRPLYGRGQTGKIVPCCRGGLGSERRRLTSGVC
jgi:hypothetical protein